MSSSKRTAILFTFAIGTAAGDLATEALRLGFGLSVVAFGALIGTIAAAYAFSPSAETARRLFPLLMRRRSVDGSA